MVQLDASGLVRSALPPHRHSVFVACTRDDHAGQLVPTAPHLLLHGILAIKHLHEHHAHTAAAFELLALVLLAQLCALPRPAALGDSQTEWREVARHFDREALDNLRAFVELTLDPAGELATRSAATWYHHEGAPFETEWPALRNDLHTAINWIRHRFSEWLPVRARRSLFPDSARTDLPLPLHAPLSRRTAPPWLATHSGMRRSRATSRRTAAWPRRRGSERRGSTSRRGEVAESDYVAPAGKSRRTSLCLRQAC